MFELTTLTKAKMLDVRVLAAKDRKPDEPPGAQLLLQATLSADVLAMFDGLLKTTLFQRAAEAEQGELDGMEGQQLTTVGTHVKRFRWDYEQTGCEVVIDYGIGGGRNISLVDCKVHRVLISPREGGSVVLQWTVDAPGLADTTWARLPNLKATEIQITLRGPEVDGQGSLDIDPPRAAVSAPEPQAEQPTPPAPAPGKKSRRNGKPDWPFGDKGEDNAPNLGREEPKLDATGAFVAAHAEGADA